MKEKDDIEELSTKILFLLQNPQQAKALGENGRQYMKENFSWPKIAGRLEELYDSLFLT